jgi:hypothetical protein
MELVGTQKEGELVKGTQSLKRTSQDVERMQASEGCSPTGERMEAV